ncbi:MAG TPA: carboxypeptidase-like regulatory domain-containing protein [Planctomycetota bacterium]|nr:carboxypeptidase-like regulatory domain-containing protein [Planctomycetota bacterium]
MDRNRQPHLVRLLALFACGSLWGCADDADRQAPAPTPTDLLATVEPVDASDFPASPATGLVAGEVHSESGRPRIAERAYLIARDAPGVRMRTARIDWEPDERPAVGRFRFEGVPDGTYELSASATVEGFAWEREALEVTAPAEGLVLTLLDAGRKAYVEIECIGRDTNRPVPGLELILTSDLPDARPATFQGLGVVQSDLVRADPGLHWRVMARGHLPIQGTLADLEPAGERGGHPLLRRRVDMLPGWTVRLRVRIGWKAPLPGARVSIDGEPVGTTDIEGLLDLRRDKAPRILRIEAPGFRPDVRFGVDGMLGDASDWTIPPVLDVTLERQ